MWDIGPPTFYIRTTRVKDVAEAGQKACRSHTVDIEARGFSRHFVSRPAVIKRQNPEIPQNEEIAYDVEMEVEESEKRSMVKVFSVYTACERRFGGKEHVIGVNVLTEHPLISSICQSFYENLVEKFGWNNVRVLFF